MVTDRIAEHSAFGVRVREHGALRGALPDRDRPPGEMHGPTTRNSLGSSSRTIGRFSAKPCLSGSRASPMGFNQAFHGAATFASPPSLEDFRKQTHRSGDLGSAGHGHVQRSSDSGRGEQTGPGASRRGVDCCAQLGTASTCRVGSEAIRRLFERCASVWSARSAEAHEWRRLKLYGTDGSTVRVPDNSEKPDE